MAAEWEETCFDVSVSDYESIDITRLQAVCRGWLVRKKLREAQAEFQQTVNELDGPAVRVDWTESTLPRPIVCKASKKMKAGKHDSRPHTREQSCENKSRTFKTPKPMTESECPKCAEKMSAHTETESFVEKNSLPVTCEQNPDKMWSDQEVQTVFSKTDHQSFVSEETHAEKDNNGDHTSTTDDVTPVKEVVCQTGSHFQTHSSPDQDCAEKDSVNRQDVSALLLEHREQHSDSERANMDLPFSSVSGTAVSSSSLLPSAKIAASDGLTSVTEPASEPLSIRRIDSFHGDQTSVWDSSSSGLQDQEMASKQTQGRAGDGHGTVSVAPQRSMETGADMMEIKLRSLSTEELVKQRQNVAMELLWVQQAIISRKKYLKLRTQMEAAA